VLRCSTDSHRGASRRGLTRLIGKETEDDAGINTGVIRSMARSGSVVTAAGLVFAFTMASFISSDLRVLGQIGTTIALGRQLSLF
jgi:uncharacterized membrane protein YdfJ with MMPL/SSD domain